MQDKYILAFALIGSIGGIFGLYYYAINYNTNFVKAQDLENHKGEIVKCYGQVFLVEKTENVMSLEIYDDTGTFKATIFLDDKKNISYLKRGDYITLKGQVQIYKGEPKIIVSDTENIKIDTLELENISSINNNSLGWIKKIRGKCINYYSIEDDIYLEIYNNSNSIQISCFGLQKNLSYIKLGDITEIYGEVIYNSDLRLKLSYLSDLNIEEPEVKNLTKKNITSKYIGDIILIEGKISSFENNGYIKINIVSLNQTISYFIKASIAKYVNINNLNLNKKIKSQGMFKIEENNLKIIARDKNDISDLI